MKKKSARGSSGVTLRDPQALIEENERLRGLVEEHAELHRRLASIHARCLELHASELELQLQLGNVVASARRLEECDTHRQVLEAITEILVNVIGSEDLAIVERGDGGEARLSAHAGERALRLRPEELAALIDVEDSDAPETVARIPLRCGRRELGVIAVFALLPHKPSLANADHEFLDLLAILAANALYRASHSASAAPTPLRHPTTFDSFARAR